MSKAFKTACIACCLCLLVCGLTAPAYAASSILAGNYDPADYLHDITISGETKTIRYDFSSIHYAFRYWENGDPSTTDYQDNFTVDLHPDATQFVVSCYPFGVVQGSHKLTKGGAVYVGDILPGSPIAFDFLLDVNFEWENRGQPFDISVTYEPVYLLFDDSGAFLDAVDLTKDTVTYTLVSDPENGYITTLTDVRHISGTIPADADYIVPFYRLRVRNSLQDQMLVTMTVQGGVTGLSVDINAVLENSNQMSAIKDKLDDLNVSIGGVNDKLDEILQQPDQEKSDATQGANDAFQDVIQVVPDHSEGLVNAFSGLAASMSYNGTVAKLGIPEISMPGLDGLFDGFIIMQPQELDFEAYFQMLPENLLLLVQSLFTGALIIFCFKELYGTIQYCMTLRG